MKFTGRVIRNRIFLFAAAILTSVSLVGFFVNPVHATDEISVGEKCEKVYSNLGRAYVDACNEGWSNKDNAQYCATLESTGQAYVDACNSGKNGVPSYAEMTACDSQDNALNKEVLCPFVLSVKSGLDTTTSDLLNNTLPFNFVGLSQDKNFTDTMSKLQTIANIIFALIFLVIIVSTAIGSPLSNYDVKKLLPRLVIAALATGISFYLCAAVVDLVNIVGAGARDLIPHNITPPNGGDAAGLLAGGAGIIIVLLLFWSAALFAVIGFAVLIVARQVILAALVLIAPIAIALALLPNTEKWFKKWLDLFIQLLIIYPAIMFIWGASQLISTVTSALGGVSAMLGAIVSSVSFILPLLVAVPLIKGSSSVMGKIHGGLTTGWKNTGGKATDASAENRRQRWATGLSVAAMNSSLLSKAYSGKVKNEGKLERLKYVQTAMKNRQKAGIATAGAMQKLSVTADDSIKYGAFAANKKIDAEGIESMSTFLNSYEIDGKHLGNNDLIKIVTGEKTSIGDTKVNNYMRSAALNTLGKKGGGGDVTKVMEYFSANGGGESEPQYVRDAFASMARDQSSKSGVFGKYVAKATDGDINVDDMYKDFIDTQLSSTSFSGTGNHPALIKQLYKYARTKPDSARKLKSEVQSALISAHKGSGTLDFNNKNKPFSLQDVQNAGGSFEKISSEQLNIMQDIVNKL